MKDDDDPAPESVPGQERHAPHEEWHVVQQKRGRVVPSRRPGSPAINDGGRLEREADRMGQRSLRPPPSRPGTGS
jgi:hypothetical protein